MNMGKITIQDKPFLETNYGLEGNLILIKT